MVSIAGAVNEGRLTGAPIPLQQDREYRQDLQASPDHRKLAFILRQDRGNIFERDLESGKERPLLTSGEDKRYPIYSPDGRRIAYYSMGGIYVMDSAGGEVRKIAEGFTRILAWSPDGRYLAALKQRKLELIAMDGAPPVKAPEARQVSTLRWSPDGKWMAFGSGEVLTFVPWNGEQGFDGGRALETRTSGTLERLSGFTGLGWAPDGGSVYLTVAKRDATELYWLKLDRAAGKLAGAPQLLRVLPPTGISYLQVLPDRLILSEIDMESDIWMLRPMVAGAAPREGL
jgi:dipeptidyl aminopeptidase/acylaminoacyl peptidase